MLGERESSTALRPRTSVNCLMWMRSDNWSAPSEKCKFSVILGDPIPPGDALSRPWRRGEELGEDFTGELGEASTPGVDEVVRVWEDEMLVFVMELVNWDIA